MDINEAVKIVNKIVVCTDMTSIGECEGDCVCCPAKLDASPREQVIALEKVLESLKNVRTKTKWQKGNE